MRIEHVDINEEMRRRQGSRTLQQWADQDFPDGMSIAYLSDVYRGKRDPGPRLLKYLGLVKIEGDGLLTYGRIK